MENYNQNYNAIDIANYIIDRSKHSNARLVKLKLHIILYYVAGQYAKHFDRLLFESKFYKWSYGPKNLELHYATNMHGYNPIEKPILQYHLGGDGRLVFDEFKLSKFDLRDMMFMDIIIDALVVLNIRQLVDAVRSEDAWLRSKDEISNGDLDIAYTFDELRSCLPLMKVINFKGDVK